jgi:hypothetical protein
MKCSFCEQPLVCKECGQRFEPPGGQTRLAMYQPDMEITCPECKHVLVCKWCGYAYGEDDGEET